MIGIMSRVTGSSNSFISGIIVREIFRAFKQSLYFPHKTQGGMKKLKLNLKRITVNSQYFVENPPLFI